MIVTTFDFLWKFAFVFLLFSVLLAFNKGSCGRVANRFLLLVSYLLAFQYDPTLAAVLAGVTLVTYVGALAVERFGRRRVMVPMFALLAILPLLAFKYYNFINANLQSLVSGFSMTASLPGLNLAVPLGISFLTLQAVGYFFDVARGHVKAERNLPDYMLFVAFFPQIASGPISKASDLMPQIKSRRHFSYDQAVSGLKWLLWGMFLKVIVADKIALSISSPLSHSASYTSLTVAVSVFLYSFQIYCDFAGYSYMALGLGRLLGFDLINNFDRPYFSTSVTEFWHRWHRSLSTWLKDHIYIPLGGSRCGRLRNYFNIMMTFLVSGLWHGASWTFVLWGGIHGAVQVAEKHLRLNKLQSKGFVRALRVAATFIIVTFAWVFFASPSARSAVDVIKNMFMSHGNKSIDFLLPLILVAIVLIKDAADEFNIKHIRLLDHPIGAVRWTAYSLIIASIMIFAEYGENFIYSGF